MSDFSASMSSKEIRNWLLELSRYAVDAVHPARLTTKWLPEAPGGETLVIGAGKAAAAMAGALESAWLKRHPHSPLSGLVVTRHGHTESCRHIEVLEASHPMPDDQGARAAQRMLDIVAPLGENDLVIALISGGGSSLMPLPGSTLTLDQKRAINKSLLRSGAPIREINTVRRHLSAIKGGRLATAAHPARVVTYLISDVPGDDPTLIASGPTLPDDSTPAQALAILEARGIAIAPEVRQHLATGTSAPKPSDAEFDRDEAFVLAKAADALEAARQRAQMLGIDARVLGDDLEGEARELGREHAEMASKLQGGLERPLLLLSGGETSVTVKGQGRGGRNVEYLLGLFQALKGASGIHALAIDTDGIDGSEDNAGAIISPCCWKRAREAGLSIEAALDDNDAYSFFEALDDLILTGPTRTNVNDFRAVLVLPVR